MRAIFNFEAQSRNFFSHLEPEAHRPYTEKQTARLLAVTARELSNSLPGMNNQAIESALASLASDQSEIVTRLSFDQHSGEGRYAINWKSGFRTV